MAETQQKGELFAGTLYLSELDPDTGEYGVIETIEVDKLAINAPSERLGAISRSREAYGQEHTTYHRPNPTEISINVTQASRKILAAKLSGVLVPLTREASTLSNVEVQLAAFGEWVRIGSRYLSAEGLTVKATSGASTSLAAGVDYEINPRLGLLRPLAGGALTAAGKAYVSGNLPALAGQTIEGASRYSREFKGELDGLNLITNQDVLVDLKRIVVSSDSEKDFLDPNLGATALSGRLSAPADGSKPYDVHYPTVAA